MKRELCGYAGKILRVNLTTKEITEQPIWDYVPIYLGGRGVANKIFWDEVKPGVKALDPENKLIIMTGATTATGIPTGGRIVIAGIAPQCYPEQYAWSGMGGWFGSELKYAGYDGIVLEGALEKPGYLFIDDQTVEIRDALAAGIWGLYTYDTQIKLESIHGKDVKSIVIGPAGENLLRMAIVATANETAAGKGGFGAVMGSKLLKGICVRGTGSIKPADVNKVLELRKTMGTPGFNTNPIKESPKFFGHGQEAEVEGGLREYNTTCSHGCNQHCPRLMMDIKSTTWKQERMNQVSKCVGPFAIEWKYDCAWMPAQTYVTEKNNTAACAMMSGAAPPPDFSDPEIPILFDEHQGDEYNFWGPDYNRGMTINELCSQYGVNKWDIIVWLMTWLSMGNTEGVFDDIDFGMEIDVESEDFMKYMLDMIVYRKGYYGNLFAEGMSRAIREMGKEKFGDTIYQQRKSRRFGGKQLDIPISFEVAWGYSAHWNGRGYEGTVPLDTWLPIAVEMMTSTRDAQTNTHHKDTTEYVHAMKTDPYGSMAGPQSVIMNETKSELKEAITTCDWQLPDMFWMTAETELFEAATGAGLTQEEIETAANRIKNLFRAITIRNYDRTRQMEVDEIVPFHRYPDADGICIDEDGFNTFVSNYYRLRGWDEKTGWPTRETYEKLGLGDVANELAALGKCPQ
ncbi:MAG: aldehyde ferredoxin oxidoreductase N-terminal domain-containing protein [Acetobacterium sp.]|uniref:aldehyde ferredoxin oxidoreductase N-terminal domain-containing protein n=1 Tax=Acetobacterium sp. TaxID=1872094 RepID=UPI003242B7FD